MTQINIHLNADIENRLKRFMQLRHISSKSEAVCIVIKEGLEQAETQAKVHDFRDWLGLAKQAPENPHPRFRSDNDLWG